MSASKAERALAEALRRERAAGEAICARTPRCSGTADCILPAGHSGFHSPRWDWFVETLASLTGAEK